MNDSRLMAEHDLERILKDTLRGEFEACWNGMKADPEVNDPGEQMAAMAAWFSEQIQATITELMEQEPIDGNKAWLEQYSDDGEESPSDKEE